jgi:hypothetical protein
MNHSGEKRAGSKGSCVQIAHQSRFRHVHEGPFDAVDLTSQGIKGEIGAIDWEMLTDPAVCAKNPVADDGGDRHAVKATVKGLPYALPLFFARSPFFVPAQSQC